MSITRHAFRGASDMPRILDLVRAMPLSWRLASPTIQEGRDAAESVGFLPKHIIRRKGKWVNQSGS